TRTVLMSFVMPVIASDLLLEESVHLYQTSGSGASPAVALTTLPGVALTRSTKRQAVEAAVLRATEELLEEGNAFAELNVERIATRAGIGRTAFYFYFRDKRELLMRLTSDVDEQLYAVASRWFTGDDDDVVSALREIGELYREHAALLRVIVEVSTYDNEV